MFTVSNLKDCGWYRNSACVILCPCVIRILSALFLFLRAFFLLLPGTASAAVCSITTDTVIDQSYVDDELENFRVKINEIMAKVMTRNDFMG